MQKYEDALWGGVALIRTWGGEIDYDTWLHYSGSIHIEQKYPGINGIGVIYAMSIEEVSSFLDLQRKRRPNFKIHPQHEGREYYPITYIEPVEGNWRMGKRLDSTASFKISPSANAWKRNSGKTRISSLWVFSQGVSRTTSTSVPVLHFIAGAKVVGEEEEILETDAAVAVEVADQRVFRRGDLEFHRQCGALLGTGPVAAVETFRGASGIFSFVYRL